jgi:hypothetical protein
VSRRVVLHAAILALVAVVKVGSVARADIADIIATIEDRALAHGVSPSWLVAVARCESTLNPFAVNGRYLGLFQLGSPGMLDTFYDMGYGSPFNVWEAADFTAIQFARGRSSAWSCA